jgi:adenylate cyclase, class 2
MSYINVEIKARCAEPDFIRNYLIGKKAEYKGTDEQTDTYFRISPGRLKLREGNIENNLIYYQRPDQAGPKNSNFYLAPVNDASALKEVLTAALGLKMIVSKRREIYYIENVKFHIDEVPGLGSFVEIEAGNIRADLSQEELLQQCKYYMKEFGIRSEDLLQHSYCDMLLENKNIT